MVHFIWAYFLISGVHFYFQISMNCVLIISPHIPQIYISSLPEIVPVLQTDLRSTNDNRVYTFIQSSIKVTVILSNHVKIDLIPMTAVALDYDTSKSSSFNKSHIRQQGAKILSIKYNQLSTYLISLLQIASGVSNSPRKISENFSDS